MDRLASFKSVISIHEDMTEYLLAHQEALVLQRETALSSFENFCALLELHIHHEDHILLPIFHRAETHRWPHKLYDGEHRKLELHMSRCREALAKLGKPTPAKAREIIALIDTEGVLKRLLEHHDERERQDLFPVLDEVTSSEERRQILQQIHQEWDAATTKLH